MRLVAFTAGLSVLIIVGALAESESKAATGKETKAVAKSTKKTDKAAPKAGKKEQQKQEKPTKTSQSQEPKEKEKQGAQTAAKQSAKAQQDQKQTAKKQSAGQAKKPVAAAQKPAARQATAPRAGSGGHVTASRVIACRNIDNREPQGTAEAFPGDVGRVYCFSHINGVRDTLAIKHVWYHEGTQVSAVPLDVRSPSWRTYSYRTIEPGQSGAWKVEVVKAASGEPLGGISFTVE